MIPRRRIAKIMWAGPTFGMYWIMTDYMPLGLIVLCAALGCVAHVSLVYLVGMGPEIQEDTPSPPPPVGPSGRVPGLIDESN